MKKHKFSFLFFWYVLLNAVSVFNYNVQAKTPKDSTSIYYQSILEIKDVNLTSRAFDFFKKKVEVALNQNDTIKAAYNLELIALGQFKMGFFHDSELTAVKAYSFIDNMKTSAKTIEPKKRLSNHLGMIYRKIADYDNALRFYNQALKLNDKLVDKIAILTNIANTYADRDNYKKAVEILMPYYDDALQMEDTGIKAIYLDELGYFQFKIGQSIALSNMQLALKISMKLEDLINLFSNYRHLCIFYMEAHNKAKSLTYLNKLKGVADKIDAPEFKLETIRLQLKLQDIPDFNRYVSLANAIEHTRQLQQNNYAAIKYNFLKKEQEARNIELKLKNSQITIQKEKLNRYVFQSIAAFGLLVTILMYFLIQAKHKKDKLQQVYNTEVRISKKVHDEVANDVYHIMTKLGQNNNVADDVLDNLEDVYNKTRDISKEHNIIDVHENYESHLKDLLLSYKSDQVNIITKDINKVNWMQLHETKKFTLYRVLQELMTNMRKHSKATLVVVKFNQHNRKISVSYKDNGIGCNLVKNNGLHNTENRMESVQGTITFDSQVNRGFSAHIIV